MQDIDDLPVETVAGERPKSAIGDRLLIGLAALALLGGVLIAGANFLAGFLPASAAEPSGTPAATVNADPTRTPRPSPTERALREISVIPGVPPEADPRMDQVSVTYWIEALEGLPIRPSIDSDEEIGRIEAGEVMIADLQPTAETGDPGRWLFVHGADVPGWVQTLDAEGRPLANLYDTDRPMFPSMVQAVAAGQTGFVVHGTPPFRGWEPGEPITLFSADGSTWSQAGVQAQPWGAWGAAWGPSGWLAAHSTTSDGVAATWLWESASGFSWSPMGALELPGHAFLMGLVGSERGYLMTLQSGDDGSMSMWFSPDGLTWQESEDVLELAGRESFYGPEAVRVAASDAGFLAWRSGPQEAQDTVAAFSTSGRSWTPIRLDPESSASWLSLAIVGDAVVGVAREAGVVRAYRADLTDIDGGPIHLVRERHLDLAFDGAVVSQIVSDGTTAYAFGYAPDAGLDLAWQRDASGWRRIDTPTGGFGQPVHAAAAGRAGVLVVGAEPNGVLTDPILWHLGLDGEWVREASDAFPSAPQPTRDDCGDPPDTAVEFMGLHPSVAVPCFGDRALTFTAWSTGCDGCHGTGEGSGRPEWLIDPTNAFFLLPVEVAAGRGEWWKEAIPAADLAWRDAYVDAWLTITGHYDDPASAGCRWMPSLMDEIYYSGILADVNGCRQRFVITEVTVVRGPSS